MTVTIHHAIGGVLVRKGRGGVAPLSPFAYRESLTVGAYQPDATTAGLLNDPARPLTVHEGDYTATVAGATVRDLEIRGRVFPGADNVTFENCWIRGPVTNPTGQDRGLFECVSPTRNATFRDCFFDPRTPGSRLDGLRYAGFTAIRCRIRRTVDGIGIFSTTAGPMNANVLGCWIEPMAKFYPDEGVHNNGTHNDGIQIQGGSGAVVRGNRIDAMLDPDVGNTGGLDVTSTGAAKNPPCPQATSAIMLNPNTGPLSNVTIEDNWIYGGILGINGLHGGFATASNLTGLVIRRNRFDRNQYESLTVAGRIGIRVEPTITCPTSGPDANVYMDNGAPVELHRRTG